MGNPILDQLNQNTGQTPNNQANGSLPTSMDDPRMNETKQYVMNHGGNPKAAFFALCKERMLNPATIINQLMGR